METTTIIGLSLIGLSLLILLFNLVSSKFKTYKGITEYKRIRDRFLVNKRENASEELEVMQEERHEDDESEVSSGSSFGSGFMKLLGSGIGFMVFKNVMRTFTEVLADDPTSMANLTPNILPAINIALMAPLFIMGAWGIYEIVSSFSGDYHE